MAADTVEAKSERRCREPERSSQHSGLFHFLSAARSSGLQARRDPDRQGGGGGEDGAGLEEKGQRGTRGRTAGSRRRMVVMYERRGGFWASSRDSRKWTT